MIGHYPPITSTGLPRIALSGVTPKPGADEAIKPDILKQFRGNRRTNMGAGGRHDVSTPRVVAGMRQVPRGTKVAECPHRMQPTDPSDLHPETINQSGASVSKACR